MPVVEIRTYVKLAREALEMNKLGYPLYSILSSKLNPKNSLKVLSKIVFSLFLTYKLTINFVAINIKYVTIIKMLSLMNVLCIVS